MGAHDNHFLQVADLVVYCAYMALVPRPDKPQRREWYATHLSKAEGPTTV